MAIKIKIISMTLESPRCILYPVDNDMHLHKTQTITWKINKGIMDYCKKANFSKQIESNIHGTIWSLCLCPNGMDSSSAGKCKIGLTLCGLPTPVQKIRFEGKITIIE